MIIQYIPTCFSKWNYNFTDHLIEKIKMHLESIDPTTLIKNKNDYNSQWLTASFPDEPSVIWHHALVPHNSEVIGAMRIWDKGCNGEECVHFYENK